MSIKREGGGGGVKGKGKLWRSFHLYPPLLQEGDNHHPNDKNAEVERKRGALLREREGEV